MKNKIIALILSCAVLAVSIPFAFADNTFDFDNIIVDDLPFSRDSAWCVRFARWISETAFDIDSSQLSPSDSCAWSIRWFNGNGQSLQHTPIVGAWIYYDWEQDGIPDHVGVVIETDGYNIKTIEGNVNDSIFARTITLDDSSVFGFNYPLSSSSQNQTFFSRSPSGLKSSFVNAVAPVDPSESNGFKAVVLALIGNYDPVVTEHRYTNSNGYTSISIDIQPDYAWWASAAFIAICLWSIFRIIGGMIKRG